MGGGAGVRWKFWLDYADLVYHPYAKKSTGVLVPAFQPALLEFEAYGYMDGMDHVRGDLLKVTQFEVVVPDNVRPDLKAQFDYWGEGAGSQQRFRLTKHDTCEDSGPSCELVTWPGFGGRGNIRNLVLDLEGDLEFERYYRSGATWSCRLEPQPLFYSRWRAVFDELDECEDEFDREDLQDDIVHYYRLPKEKRHGR